jgi:hypothetical protein
MGVNVKRKDPAAVALGRKGGRKGGPARAARLTPEQRSESARKAVQARWGKGLPDQAKEARSATAPVDTSKKALHLCLKRIKAAEKPSELRRLTQELQRIVFRRQYQNAED